MFSHRSISSPPPHTTMSNTSKLVLNQLITQNICCPYKFYIYYPLVDFSEEYTWMDENTVPSQKRVIKILRKVSSNLFCGVNCTKALFIMRKNCSSLSFQKTFISIFTVRHALLPGAEKKILKGIVHFHLMTTTSMHSPAYVQKLLSWVSEIYQSKSLNNNQSSNLPLGTIGPGLPWYHIVLLL